MSSVINFGAGPAKLPEEVFFILLDYFINNELMNKN